MTTQQEPLSDDEMMHVKLDFGVDINTSTGSFRLYFGAPPMETNIIVSRQVLERMRDALTEALEYDIEGQESEGAAEAL